MEAKSQDVISFIARQSHCWIIGKASFNVAIHIKISASEGEQLPPSSRQNLEGGGQSVL